MTKLHIILCIPLMFLLSCNDPVTQEELIESAIQLKLQSWRQDEIKKCMDKAMVEAEAFVDSILIVRSLPSKLDTIPKPPKPMKPPKPYFKTKPDSVVVRPIKKDE